MGKTPIRSIAVTSSIMIGVLAALLLVGRPLLRLQRSWQQSRFDELILKAAGENGCDPCLVKAVVWRESKFDPLTRGTSGEIGLMQIMPSVAAEWGESHGQKLEPKDLLNPEVNLRVGSWYLAKAIQQWSQASEPVPLALGQYNAGRSNVLKWVDANSLADRDAFIERIQFPTTRSYVKVILKQYLMYQQQGEF